jgi:hypothetical protein
MRDKEKFKEYMKMYREKNKEKIAEKKREYNEKNKEDLKIKRKEYREKNIEKNSNYMCEYRKNKNEKIIETSKVWYQENKEKIKLKKEHDKEKIKKYQKNYYQKIKDRRKKYVSDNRESINKTQSDYKKTRRMVDPLFKLSNNISRNIRLALKADGFSKNSKTIEILGCSILEFKNHLEKKFKPWMSWDNYGKYKKGVYNYGWDIDHMIPQSSAKTEDELILLNHYSNMCPLCSYTNRHIKRNIFKVC